MMKLDPVQIVHELALDPNAFSTPYSIDLAQPGTHSELANGPRYTPFSPQMTDIEKVFKDQMHRVFWARIDRAKESNFEEWVEMIISLLTEMRQRLVEILPRRMNSEKARLEEALDEEYVRGLLKSSTFGSKEVSRGKLHDKDQPNFHNLIFEIRPNNCVLGSLVVPLCFPPFFVCQVLGLFEYTFYLITKLEAPPRVPQSQQWWDDLNAKVEADPNSVPSLIPDLFRFVNDKLEQVQYDMLFAEINILRPIAEARAVEFEREHVDLHDPTVTKNWLQRVVLNLSTMFGSGPSPFVDGSRLVAEVAGKLAQQTQQQQQQSEAANPPSVENNDAPRAQRSVPVSAGVVREVIAAGLLDLVSCPTPIVPVPESFSLDAHRIHGFQNKFQECVLLGIAVSLAHTFHSKLRPKAVAGQLKPWLLSLCDKLSALVASNRFTMAHFREAIKDHLLSHPALKNDQGESASATSTESVDAVKTTDGVEGEVVEDAKQTEWAKLVAEAGALAATLDSSFKADHPLYLMVQTRLMRFAFDLLLGRTEAVEAVKSGTNVPVSFVVANCSDWLDMCRKLLTFNLGVHQEQYASLVEDIVDAL
eukprot:c6854_g1_i1.p1 GENE.c6854_g1_i1~~c6854_g1_i1.p1  ORF type:complete len:607 (-),score=137.55 c6854_g1_i1:184-1953(-)